MTLTLAATAVACGGSSLSGRAARPAPHGDSAAVSAPEPAAESAVSDSGDGDYGGEARSAPASPPAADYWGGQAPSKADRSAEAQVAPEPEERPGLGTEWGETRYSRITTTPFLRADNLTPTATASLFYNDAQGARAMSNAAGYRHSSGAMLPMAGGAVLVGLRDEHGHFLSGFVAGSRNYVVGEAGRRYTIVLQNRTSSRFEAVVSVDGLDVLDGREASFEKRGYLLDPHGELEIDGFRQSMDAVAAFRFGSVRDSYANQKHGDTRNVGVIGVALFHERGDRPLPWTHDEVRRRHQADPFPGQFADPPSWR